ncbi:MAG: toxin-antitoxin system HicB family antitoxin [Bifidobacteriaceae bacterium]|nr:toxin-antitoxin system HicB family antitoxin [Bifidobacteriaceae bacterium]
MGVYTNDSQATTIRVEKRVRDALARRAAESSVSINAFIDELLEREDRQRAYAEHRAALRAQAANPDRAMTEDLALWESTDQDGLADG